MRRDGQCCADIKRNGYWTGKPCTRMATVERDGKSYCTQHDPKRVRAEKEQRDAARMAEIRNRNARDDYNVAHSRWLAECGKLVEDFATGRLDPQFDRDPAYRDIADLIRELHARKPELKLEVTP